MEAVLKQVEDWPVDTVAVGITTADGVVATHGSTGHVFPLASVTKPLAAYATLVAVRDGLLHLDEPAGPDGSTLRHLLAHASGLPPSPGGPTSPVGRRRVYSNVGYEQIGELVADRVGTSFEEHLSFEVTEPLGMTSTALDGSPAADAHGTVDDLLTFARELLDPTLLDTELVTEARTVQFPGLDGVLPGFGRQSPNDWGLGFEIRDGKSPHWTGPSQSPNTFGHFGQSGSFFWVDPDAGLAAALLTDRPFGEWAAEVWPAFNDAIFASATGH